MLAERAFDVVLVSPRQPVGFSFFHKADRRVRYHGESMTLSFR